MRSCPCGTSWDAPVEQCPTCGSIPATQHRILHSTKIHKPTGDVLLLTKSRMWIIGDWYQGAWRTCRSEWMEIDGKQVLVSAYAEEDITHWTPLPDPLTLPRREPLDRTEIW